MASGHPTSRAGVGALMVAAAILLLAGCGDGSSGSDGSDDGSGPLSSASWSNCEFLHRAKAENAVGTSKVFTRGTGYLTPAKRQYTTTDCEVIDGTSTTTRIRIIVGDLRPSELATWRRNMTDEGRRKAESCQPMDDPAVVAGHTCVVNRNVTADFVTSDQLVRVTFTPPHEPNADVDGRSAIDLGLDAAAGIKNLDTRKS